MSDGPRRVEGACACGGVRLRLDLPTRFVAHCHCANCRRAHGAGFVTFAGVPAAQLGWTAGEDLLAAWKTDTGATRRFCGRCGTTLTYEGPRWPDEIHVVVACLDGELDRAPQGHAYADRKADWIDLPDDGLPRFGGESGSEQLD